MVLRNEKMVLTGGAFSRKTLDAALELSGASGPKVIIDTSPRVSRTAYEQTRRAYGKWFLDNGRIEPEWLNAEYASESRSAVVDKLETADVLMITGGSTKQAMRRWEASGMDDIVLQRVKDGELVVHGASAGAMMWFRQGYSDSMQYETQGRKWSYILTKGTGVIPAWVTAHHDEADEYGRDRAEGFRRSLADHYGEWKTAIGLESYATMVCVDGMVKIIDAGKGDKSFDVHIYTPNNQGLPCHETITGAPGADEWFSLAGE